jgi:hypothetical protein
MKRLHWMNSFLLFVSLNMIFLPKTWAESQEDKEIFKRQMEWLNRRYEDFFQHDEWLEEFHKKVEAGAKEKRLEREKVLKEDQKAAEEFRRRPREKADTTELELDHERQKAKVAQRHEEARKEFVEHRDQLRKISESARKIPENRDAGLE